MRFIKFVKLTGYTTYACHSLTNLELEAHAMTRNGNQVKFVKSQQVNLFWAGNSHFEPLCATV